MPTTSSEIFCKVSSPKAVLFVLTQDSPYVMFSNLGKSVTFTLKGGGVKEGICSSDLFFPFLNSVSN